MGCGCKDANEGLNIQDKPSELPVEAFDEFQSKIDSLQSEKNIWKQSYQELSSEITAITSKLDAILDTLPSDIQERISAAFTNTPVENNMSTEDPSAMMNPGRKDTKFSFSVEIYAEIAPDFDECSILENISIGTESEHINILQIRIGEATLEETNNDAARAEIRLDEKARMQELGLF